MSDPFVRNVPTFADAAVAAAAAFAEVLIDRAKVRSPYHYNPSIGAWYHGIEPLIEVEGYLWPAFYPVQIIIVDEPYLDGGGRLARRYRDLGTAVTNENGKFEFSAPFEMLRGVTIDGFHAYSQIGAVGSPYSRQTSIYNGRYFG